MQEQYVCLHAGYIEVCKGHQGGAAHFKILGSGKNLDICHYLSLTRRHESVFFEHVETTCCDFFARRLYP